jgi:ribosomal protein S27AE
MSKERDIIRRMADRLLEHCGHCPEDKPGDVTEAECPHCGGPGILLGRDGHVRFRCQKCGKTFSEPYEPEGMPRPKAEFYPSDGGTWGGGGGITST